MGDLKLAVEQSAIDVMYAHGTVVRTGNAAEEGGVTGGGGSIDVYVLPCGGANELDKIGRAGRSFLHFVLLRRGKGRKCQDGNKQHIRRDKHLGFHFVLLFMSTN
jgi:hypothetical protein